LKSTAARTYKQEIEQSPARFTDEEERNPSSEAHAETSSQPHTLAPLNSPNPLQVFSMPLNAAHHDEEEVAFIAFARATSRQQHITNFICSLDLFPLLLPLALDWGAFTT
jgi:hypothetical protein